MSLKVQRLENGLLHVDLVRKVPGGDEASGNSDRDLQQGLGGSADQGRRLTL
jgi:hypothetical protein